MTAPIIEPTDHECGVHPCRACASPIANRYTFRTCNACALVALVNDPAVVAWREAKRTAAYERLERAGLVPMENGHDKQ